MDAYNDAVFACRDAPMTPLAHAVPIHPRGGCSVAENAESTHGVVDSARWVLDHP
jgi:hypothetical protein